MGIPAGPIVRALPFRPALPPNYSRPIFTADEAAEIFHNRPTPTHALELKPGQAKPRSAIWPRSWARLRGDVAIVEIARGPAARERAAMALGPRWEVVHTEHGGPFHGALTHPEFPRALRAA